MNVVVSSLTLMSGYLRVTASARPCQIFCSSGVSDHIDQRRDTGPLLPPPLLSPPQPGSPTRPTPARPAPAALRNVLRSRRSSRTSCSRLTASVLSLAVGRGPHEATFGTGRG